MKKLLLALIFLHSGTTLVAQCPATDIELTTQAQVDNFKVLYPNCTEFTKRIAILQRFDGPSITNINGLSNLRKIDKLFFSNTDVSSLLPLSNLTEVSGIGFSECSKLTSLAGLSSLTRIGYSFFSNNTPLASLAALSNVTFLGSLFIRTSELTSLDGLENVKQMMTLSLVYNSSLENIDAIDNVEFVDARVPGETDFGLELIGNELLSDCSNAVVCRPFMTGKEDYVILEVQGNGTGCATEAEITQACLESLPVNLIQFEARHSGENGVQINWATSSETDSKFFEVQRGSNGRSWRTVGSVAAQGKSESSVQYSFVDTTPVESNNLYRLKMVDMDGSFTFSKIVSVKFPNASPLSFYPNPVDDNLVLREFDGISSAKISDLNGKILYKSHANPGREIDTTSLPSGLFILSLEKKDGSTSRLKFVKK